MLLITSVEQVEFSHISLVQDGVEMSARFPRFRNLSDRDFQNRLNSELETVVRSFFDEVVREARSRRKLRENLPNFQAEVYTRVRYYSHRSNLLSFTLHLYSWTFGGHGSERVVAYSIDLRACRKIEPQRFLDESGLRNLKAALVESVGNHGGIFYPDASLYIETDPRLDDLSRPMFITPRELVVVYEPFELAPGPSGSVELGVEWHKLGIDPRSLNFLDPFPRSKLKWSGS